MKHRYHTTMIGVIKKEKKVVSAEQLALRTALSGGFLAAAIALLIFLLFGSERIGISGGVSMTLVGFYSAVVGGFAAYLVAYRDEIRRRIANDVQSPVGNWILWRDSVSLALAYSIVTGGVLILFSRLMDQSFQGMTLDIVSAALIVGGIVGGVLYILVNSAYDTNSQSLIRLFATILVGGVLFSMFTNTNTDWWRENFSTLGMSVSSANIAFNLTLILAALVMAALIGQVFATLDEIAEDYEHIHRQLKLRALKLFFVAIAIAFGCIGLFHYVPDTIFATLHNLSAFGLVILFTTMIALLKFLAPGFSKEFLFTSYLIAGSLIGSYILFTRVGYLSLTAFELLCFVLCFTWLILFLRNIELVGRQALQKGKTS